MQALKGKELRLCMVVVILRCLLPLVFDISNCIIYRNCHYVIKFCSGCGWSAWTKSPRNRPPECTLMTWTHLMESSFDKLYRDGLDETESNIVGLHSDVRSLHTAVPSNDSQKVSNLFCQLSDDKKGTRFCRASRPL